MSHDSSSPTSSSAVKPTTLDPPPTYSESAEPQYYFPQPSSLPSTTPAFGPTPLALPQQQAVLLPYYDARSPHSIAMAVRRARWRFVGAVMWAIVFVLVITALAGSGAEAWKWNVFRIHSI
jgi:hypothetical protein